MQALREERPGHETSSNKNGGQQKHVVGTTADCFAIRVVAHVSYGTPPAHNGTDGVTPDDDSDPAMLDAGAARSPNESAQELPETRFRHSASAKHR